VRPAWLHRVLQAAAQLPALHKPACLVFCVLACSSCAPQATACDEEEHASTVPSGTSCTPHKWPSHGGPPATLRLQHLLASAAFGVPGSGTNRAPPLHHPRRRCPICQLDLPSFDKLRTHTRTLHGQDLLQRSMLSQTLTSASRSTSLGNVATYCNSAGQAFEPQYGLMMSLRYVLLREGVDVRPVNNATRDVTSAINRGIEGLVEKLAAGAARPEEQQVVVVVADTDGHAQVLRRCRGLGITTVAVCQDVLDRQGADVTLRWPWLRSGVYSGVGVLDGGMGVATSVPVAADAGEDDDW
jgi:hypothetical protein